MSSKHKTSLFVAIIVLLLASLACSSVQEAPVPTSLPENTAVPEVIEPAPTAEPVATEEVPVQTGGAFDGAWSGTNSDEDSEIFFEVTDNQITSVTINYLVDLSDCSFSGAVSMGIDPSPIDGDAFSATFTAPNDYEYTFAGNFTSDTEASGTIHVKGPSSGLCGEFEKDLTWSAGKGTVAESEPAPTEETSTQPDVNSDLLVTQFFDAVNAGDVDAALALVDENVMFSFGPQAANQFGRDNLETYLLSNQGTTYQISETSSVGGTIIQFKATLSDGTVYGYCQAFTQDGKITMLSLQP